MCEPHDIGAESLAGSSYGAAHDLEVDCAPAAGARKGRSDRELSELQPAAAPLQPPPGPDAQELLSLAAELRASLGFDPGGVDKMRCGVRESGERSRHCSWDQRRRQRQSSDDGAYSTPSSCSSLGELHGQCEPGGVLSGHSRDGSRAESPLRNMGQAAHGAAHAAAEDAQRDSPQAKAVAQEPSLQQSTMRPGSRYRNLTSPTSSSCLLPNSGCADSLDCVCQRMAAVRNAAEPSQTQCGADPPTTNAAEHTSPDSLAALAAELSGPPSLQHLAASALMSPVALGHLLLTERHPQTKVQQPPFWKQDAAAAAAAQPPLDDSPVSSLAAMAAMTLRGSPTASPALSSLSSLSCAVCRGKPPAAAAARPGSGATSGCGLCAAACCMHQHSSSQRRLSLPPMRTDGHSTLSSVAAAARSSLKPAAAATAAACSVGREIADSGSQTVSTTDVAVGTADGGGAAAEGSRKRKPVAAAGSKRRCAPASHQPIAYESQRAGDTVPMRPEVLHSEQLPWPEQLRRPSAAAADRTSTRSAVPSAADRQSRRPAEGSRGLPADAVSAAAEG